MAVVRVEAAARSAARAERICIVRLVGALSPVGCDGPRVACGASVCWAEVWAVIVPAREEACVAGFNVLGWDVGP